MDKHKSGAHLLAKITTLALAFFTCSSSFAEGDKLHRLPSGPEGPGEFGAYYTQLKFDDAWDAAWRIGPDADVVVRFEDGAHRFVFWRGTSYIPCWVTDTGVWYTDEFLERRGGSSGTKGCVEPMSDKQTRYSHVRIIESHEARVQIHWRYSPVDVNYRHAYVDEATGWGDWVDEYYTIYPDGVGIRHATLHTTEPEKWTEWQEAIVINQPGTMPEENIELNAVTLANMQGESKTFTWTADGGPPLEGITEPNIQIINLKAERKPFQVVPPVGLEVNSYRGHGPNSCFNFWNHWPVAQEASYTTVAESADKPSHSSLSQLEWDHYAQGDNWRSKIMLQGMTNKPASELLPLAKSWLSAPKLESISEGYASEGYDQTQRAFVLSSTKSCDAKKLEFTLAASKEHPAINPAFVIKNWGDNVVALTLNSKAAEHGKAFRYGHRHTLEGTDLIVWILAESMEPMRVVLQKAQ